MSNFLTHTLAVIGLQAKALSAECSKLGAQVSAEIAVLEQQRAAKRIEDAFDSAEFEAFKRARLADAQRRTAR